MDRRFAWAAVLGAALLAVGVGVMSYNAGVSHGLAIAVPPPGSPAGAPVPYYGWYRPWGFGFGFAPFLFLLFWFFALRMLFWGGFRRRWYYREPYDAPSHFEEWHRRAHERMGGAAPPQPHGSA